MTRIYALIFFFSGATGLIYESVWSHYIKLILGHAAYAQTLVLGIFMGGMAIGAWWVSKRSGKIRNLLLAYALVEAFIGVFGIFFHALFGQVSHLLFESFLPAADGDVLAMAIKWGVSALLILPQSILLGFTFPLMTGGVARLNRTAMGSAIALLYFANSIGAVFGVLWAGFYLLSWVGLPGALMTAGLLNIVISIVVYRLSRGQADEVVPDAVKATGASAGVWILLASAVTGAASFCYEIGWIRMLSMVLGSSTHAFELMLAAFILGLALGGLWIRKRIDTLKSPMRFLGFVQIAMGILALLTLPLYNWTFDLMAYVMAGLGRNAAGYTFFSIFSHGIALLIMLPATFCAGMTLPLLTVILWKQGAGEKAIGQVYAVNTLGSIVGVVLAVHVFMPGLGLKGLILAGSLMDGVLGVGLLGMLSWGTLTQSGAVVFGLGWLAVLLFSHLDPLRMGAGVYRTGMGRMDQAVELLSWQDGKTASISLLRFPSGIVNISTNGKPDAAIQTDEKKSATPDEATMLMLALVPMLYKPDAKVVANIGFGSGMTTHALLAFPGIERLDNVEIEPEMFKAARLGYEKKVPRAFQDPRSVLHIDDARTFFSTRNLKYDVIVSEPSNPWVSGTASLFSKEFYRHAVRYLNADGVFVQWLQLYETDLSVLSSVTGALDQVFEDYVIYATDTTNLLIVARPKGKLPPPELTVLQHPDVRAEWRRFGFTGFSDIDLRRVATKRIWSPLMAGRASVNSDYFPFVDLNAARFRFIGAFAVQATQLGEYPVPILEMLGVRQVPLQRAALGQALDYPLIDRIHDAWKLRDVVLEGGGEKDVHPDYLSALAVLRVPQRCPDMGPAQRLAIFRLAYGMLSYLPASELNLVWNKLATGAPCLTQDPLTKAWFDLIRATSNRDPAGMVLAAKTVWPFQEKEMLTDDMLEFLLLSEMLGHQKTGGTAAVQRFYETRLKTHVAERRLSNPLLFDLLIRVAARAPS